MKNSLDVYESIEYRDERMSLAKRYKENFYIVCNDHYVNKKIAELEKEIIKLKEAKGINEHMRMRGWNFFDISDDVVYDETYLSFVGTRKELFERIPNPSAYSEEECGI